MKKLKKEFPDLEVDVIKVVTKGDRNPYQQPDLKSAFTEDIERLLLEGKVDAAVHSLKDVPTELDDSFLIASTPERADPRDTFVSKSGKRLEELDPTPRIGTSSLRRIIQIKHLRPDAEIVQLHGNVDTRLNRYMSTGLDGIVVAAAGLHRLGLSSEITQYFDPDVITPAPCQGIIAVETRKDMSEVIKMFERIEEKHVRIEAESERAFASRLGGGCKIPAGVLVQRNAEGVKITGFLASRHRIVRDSISCSVSKSIERAAELAEKLTHLVESNIG